MTFAQKVQWQKTLAVNALYRCEIAKKCFGSATTNTLIVQVIFLMTTQATQVHNKTNRQFTVPRDTLVKSKSLDAEMPVKYLKYQNYLAFFLWYEGSLLC